MKKNSYPLKSAELGPLEPKVISNWDFRELFYLPIEKPGPGLPRAYSRENLLELAIAIEMIASGFTREHVLQAFRSRARYSRSSRSGRARAGYILEPAELFASAPELQQGSEGFRWLVFCTSDIHNSKDRGDVVACFPFRDEEAADVFAEYEHETFSVMPISHVVARLDRSIARWESEQS